MGRLRVQLAVSADGLIGATDGSFDWLAPFPAGEFGFDAFIASIRGVVMGRTSYQEMLRMGPPPFGALPTVVVTSRPLEPAPGVTAVPLSGLREAVRALPGDVWLFGGGKTIAACLEQKLVDTLELAVIPRLLGAGVPLFRQRAPALDELRLVSARPMKKDVLWLEYQVVR